MKKFTANNIFILVLKKLNTFARTGVKQLKFS
jgi:hypothetical protein